ncbi:hypothetical protein [Amycolatopsis sp. NPDC021455]
MLCGLTAVAEFRPLSDRRARSVPRQCSRCEAIYRREHGIVPSPVRRS